MTALGCLSYLFVYNQMSLILTQIILGLSQAVLSPAFDAIYSEHVDRKKSTSEWGDWEAMQFIVTAIAAITGGYLANQFGFKSLFVFMFIISLGSIFTSIHLFKTKKLIKK